MSDPFDFEKFRDLPEWIARAARLATKANRPAEVWPSREMLAEAGLIEEEVDFISNLTPRDFLQVVTLLSEAGAIGRGIAWRLRSVGNSPEGGKTYEDSQGR